jgi:hypothetical protein
MKSDVHPPEPGTPIGLIAGAGQFPLLFADRARERGYAVHAVAYRGEADPSLADRVADVEWLHLGQLRRLIRYFKKNGVDQAVMMGAIRKTRIFTDVRPDTKAIAILARMRHTHDDGVLRAFARALEDEGIAIQPSTFLLPELLAPAGCWTRRRPSRAERNDIDLGRRLAGEVGRLDIGQCLVVGGGSVLAVEAIDGTDATLERGGNLGEGEAVAVKVCKPDQDARFDIPAVGAGTVETMIRAGVRALAVEAGRAVVFDREAMIRRADQNGIAIVGVEPDRPVSSEPPAAPAEEPEATPEIPAAPAAGAAENIDLQRCDAAAGLPEPAEPRTRETAPLRTAVVGVGYLGRFHAQKYARMADVRLVGVVDTDPERAQTVAAEVGTDAFTDHRDLFGRVDAVSIVVPTPAHFPVARDFLERDVDVLIEKPITTTVAEADELNALAESRGRIIQVGHLERFNPAVVAVKDVVDKPLFIESHRLAIFKPRGIDVSVVLDLMIHDIDIIINLVQSEVKSIHAAGVAAVSDHVDIANARLEFESGCVANVTASRVSMKNERKIRLFQRDAYLSLNFADRNVTVVRKEGDEAPAEGGVIPGMDIQQFCFTEGDALESEIKSFAHSVRTREVREVTGQMARDALHVALAVMEQIRSAQQQILGG